MPHIILWGFFMQNFNDEKIIDDNLVKDYNEEYEKIIKQKDNEKNSLCSIEVLKAFQDKVLIQNLINIVSEILSLLEVEIGMLNDLMYHIPSIKQNETKVKIRILQEQEKSLNLLYETENIQNLNFVKISQNKPLLKNLLDVCCMLMKCYMELDNFEMNVKIKDIIKKYKTEILNLILFLSDFLV